MCVYVCVCVRVCACVLECVCMCALTVMPETRLEAGRNRCISYVSRAPEDFLFFLIFLIVTQVMDLPALVHCLQTCGSMDQAQRSVAEQTLKMVILAN